MISIQRLREAFEFDEESGILVWRIRTSNRVNIGDVAGKLAGNGYLYVGLDGHVILAHRAIFAMKHGFFPDNVDHIDGNKINNRISNLRAASKADNSRNARLSAANTSGMKGVYWDKRKRKWYCQILSEGKRFFVGYFDNALLANEAIKPLRERLHGEFARHG